MDYSGYYNGRPCKACTSTEEMLQISKQFAAKKKAAEKQKTENEQTNAGNDIHQTYTNTTTLSLEEEELTKDGRRNCPVDKDELGRSTWNLLHTMSVYYPKKPSDAERNSMENTLNYLSQTYPCPPCAEDLRRDLKSNPPQLENRDAFANWMCEMHNRVNTKLGKPNFDCNRVMERWYDGWKDGSCD